MPEYEYDMIGVKGDFSDDDYKEAGRAANEYSVSLVKGTNQLIGSATLVSIGKLHGLLTADHVWQCLLKDKAKDHFCMVIGPHLQRFEYPFEGCTPIIVGKYSSEHEEEGPDLTFIGLDNPEKLETLKSRKSFYPLNTQKGKTLAGLPHGSCPWLVWGTPGEKSSKSATETGEPILKVTHFVGHSDFVGNDERDGFDYMKVRIRSGSENYPERYGGVSGGGVWIPYCLSEDSEGKVIKPTLNVFLAGVAYYQLNEEVNYKTLILHGPKSIYERVIQAVFHSVGINDP